MNQDEVVTLMRYLLYVGALTAGPLIVLGLVVGVVMGVLQAATQIQEASLSFVPKLAALGTALIVAGPYFLDRMVTFTGRIIAELARMGPQGRL